MSTTGNTGAPTPRRSERLSARPSSIINTIVTNGASRLNHTGPLTQVKARRSNAYGATGRAAAAEALSLSTSGFAQAFQSQRGDAYARDHGEVDNNTNGNGAINRGLASPSPAPSSAASEAPSVPASGLSFLRSQGGLSSHGSRANSPEETSKSFGYLHETGMLGQHNHANTHCSSSRATPDPTPVVRRPPPSQAESLASYQTTVPLRAQGRPPLRPSYQQTPAHVRTPSQLRALHSSIDELISEERANAENEDRARRNVEPPREEADGLTWITYLKWAIWAILALMFVGRVLHVGGPSPALSPHTTTTATAAFPDLFSAVNSRVGYTVNKVAEYIRPGPVPLTEAEQVAAFRAGDDNLLWLRMLNMDKKFDARIDGVDATINELREELPETLVVRRYKDGRSEVSDDFWQALLTKLRSEQDDSEWLAFLAENRQKLLDMLGSKEGADSNGAKPAMVSRQEFLEILDERSRELAKLVNENVDEVLERQKEEVKKAVGLEARKAMIDNIRLQSLAQANLLANYELAMKSPNYLSTGLGAVVDPRLTSATRLDRPRWFGGLAQRLGLLAQRNPPQAALMEWRQPGDCWCSAGNREGDAKSQLAVSLGRAMYPKRVTIDHVPKSMIPAGDVSTAPRDMELWVETSEPVHPLSRQREPDCGKGPKGWKCLGHFQYDINRSNHVQTFDLQAATTTPIKRAMLRATTNWGADFTCLYQARLHGDDAREDHVFKIR